MDRILTVSTEISIKSYIFSEFFSSMENQVPEYISFGGVQYYVDESLCTWAMGNGHVQKVCETFFPYEFMECKEISSDTFFRSRALREGIL